MRALGRALGLLRHQATKLQGSSSHGQLPRPIRTADRQLEIRDPRLEGRVVGKRDLEDRPRLAAAQLLPAGLWRGRPRRDRERRRVDGLERVDVARVVLHGDPDRDVLAERDFFGLHAQLEREGGGLADRRRQREEQRRDHAVRLRVRARNSAARGAT